MSLYKTQPINRDDDMNPFIETEIVTNEILVGQPIPYRIQNILDKSKKNILNTYNYYCDKCKIKYVEKKIVQHGFNNVYLKLYIRRYCQNCA